MEDFERNAEPMSLKQRISRKRWPEIFSACRLTLGIGVFALLSSGCYPGPRTIKVFTGPDSPVAILRPDIQQQPGYKESVIIYSMDGVPLGDKSRGWPEEVHVLPGKHVLEVGYINSKTARIGFGRILPHLINPFNVDNHRERAMAEYIPAPFQPNAAHILPNGVVYTIKHDNVLHQFITVDVRAGRQYVLTFHSNGDGPFVDAIWAEDLTTGEMASDQKTRSLAQRKFQPVRRPGPRDLGKQFN
jgi:hypothetical protein